MAGKKRASSRLTNTACALSDRNLIRALDGEIASIDAVDAVPELIARDATAAFATLRGHLASAREDHVRASCAAALGAKRTAANCKALVAALKDPSLHVVRRAAESLGRIGGRAELSALRKLKPHRAVTQRAVTAAKTLLCYRLGDTRGVLRAPADVHLLELDLQRSAPIDVTTASLEALGLTAHVSGMLADLRPADTALAIDCGRWSYLAVFSRRLFAGGASAFEQRPGVLGVLLRRERVDNLFYRYAYLFAQPHTRGGLHVFAMRGNADVAYYGTVEKNTVGKAVNLDFAIQALSTRHTRPVEFSGRIVPKTRAFADIAARVAKAKDPSQPAQRKPRALRPALRSAALS